MKPQSLTSPAQPFPAVAGEAVRVGARPHLGKGMKIQMIQIHIKTWKDRHVKVDDSSSSSLPQTANPNQTHHKAIFSLDKPDPPSGGWEAGPSPPSIVLKVLLQFRAINC